MDTTDYAKIWSDVIAEGERTESSRDDFSSYLRTQLETDGRTYDAELIRSENRREQRLWRFEGKFTDTDEECWNLVWSDTTFS